ncbi:MAG: PAS domain S-box protein [Bacteroidia bacterium]|nr:PAS domain S-box protein [Bacteroidia bacterium]
MEACSDPLFTLDNNGIITLMNEAATRLTGANRKTLIGSFFFNYFTDAKEAKRLFEQVLKNGITSLSPLTICQTSGEVTNVLLSGSQYNDLLSKTKGVVMVVRDMNENKSITSGFDKNAYEISAYKTALDESSIVAITNAKGMIEYANNNFCKISKYSREELIGQDHRILNSGFHPKEFMRSLWTTIQAGTVWRGEIKNKAKDGSIYWVDTTIVPFTNEEGNIYQYISVRYDITAKKVLSQYSLSLIEASRDPLVTISPIGKIMDMNEAMVTVTGIDRSKLKGSDFKIYFTNPEKASQVYQEVFKKGFVADYPLVIKDHKLTDVLFNGSVYKDDQGNVMGAVIVARDITEQKRNEKELLEAITFAELATGMAENAKAEAESAAQTAKESVKAKQQFLSNMSHEIRTPMNAIIGFTKVVLKTELTAKQREYLMAIKMSGDALIVLINDILDLAKVDAGKMVFEQSPFRMALSISAMLHLFEPKIHEKNLHLIKEYDVAIPDVLLGDSVRLHQIILNLVSNAVKFTNSGTITVSVKLVSDDSEKVKIEFSVTDTGIGINEEKIEKIFENFQQASSGTSRLYGGTGLGLAIVKQLVEQQGGQVKVVSKINLGSTFSFTLDFNKTSVEALDEAELILRDEKLTHIKVLVVEDIVLNQLLMKTLLDDFGFERDIAANGKVAIEKLRKKKYDIILMDLQMPLMNGFETTDYIRNTLKLSIPIVALTADVTTVDLAKCKAVGMNDYIAKPVDEKALYNKIVTLIKKNKSVAVNELAEVVGDNVKQKCTNLQYLTLRTKSDPNLMMEMISLYLEQTPSLINSMKESLFAKDWTNLHATVHKMIPSFAIMGIDPDFENMAKKIQEFARTQEQWEEIDEMVIKLENICAQACVELEEEFNLIKNNKL